MTRAAMSSRPLRCYVSKAIEEDLMMGSPPEVKSHQPLKLCSCLVHIRSTSEHSVQITLDVVHIFHSAAKKVSMSLTGTAEIKI